MFMVKEAMIESDVAEAAAFRRGLSAKAFCHSQCNGNSGFVLSSTIFSAEAMSVKQLQRLLRRLIC
jgi:hypothetical protein